ncbi:hypothetical protein GALL_100200 [mine drainage metagenome]|uniref:Uncharacterized protein n=1 Tax=mine drainage metagenome TaxID=410659 RepID=A0A1J5SH78_9ZZZZ
MALETDQTKTPTPLDAVAIGGIVRDELDRRDKYLEFAQGQIEKDRAYFKHLYNYAVAFLAILVGGAAYFSYTSVNQMRGDIKASADAERTEMKSTVDAELNRDKAEMAALRTQVENTGTEAQITVKKELENIRTEVQKKIDTEFRSENITHLIGVAAKERTEKELTRVINSEASKQVAQGIKDQWPEIQKVVEDQTKDAVKALQPTISSAVDKATQEQVKTSVEPIQNKLAAYDVSIRIGSLATLAHGDNRQAFDELLEVALGNKPESTNPDLRNMADATVGAIIQSTESGLQMGYSFKEKQTPDSMKQFLLSPNQLDRAAALDNYPPNDITILPTLVTMIKSDTSINVLHKAVVRFNTLTKQSFRFFQTKEILDWWDKNKSSFQ